LEQKPPIPESNRHKNLFINGISGLEYTFIIQACFYFTEIRRITPRQRIAHYIPQGCTNTGRIFHGGAWCFQHNYCNCCVVRCYCRVVLCIVCFVSFCVFFCVHTCTVLLPPGVSQPNCS